MTGHAEAHEPAPRRPYSTAGPSSRIPRDTPAHVTFCNGARASRCCHGHARREGHSSADRARRGCIDPGASVDGEGSPGGWPACAAASRQETRRVGGIRCRCPPVEQRAPFVRGCVPKDVDPSHDTGRVRLLVQQTALTTAATAHRWCLRPRPKASCFRPVVLCLIRKRRRAGARRHEHDAVWRATRAWLRDHAEAMRC